MKKCELCKKVARMYCDSNQASLCWDCDSRVHTANFLVAKHTRTLLCHACQHPTPWTGFGPKLSPTVSVCRACVNGRYRSIHDDRNSGNGNAEDENSVYDEDEHDIEENGNSIHDGDDDDGENQVLPSSLPPSLALFSSSSEEPSSRRDSFFSSRFGPSKATTIESSRFSCDEVEKENEKNGTQNLRSWKW